MGRTALRAVGTNRFRRIVREISWYWGTLMGDTHYRRYLEYRQRAHPGEPLLSERDYWRQRHSTDGGARCC
ncbi:MAG: YbdD/YjiX family protein [Mycobacterium sp.]|nr:YbdD/YjiX family protein [Mycobacterium sp.]